MNANGVETYDIGVETYDIGVKTYDIGVETYDIGVKTYDIGVEMNASVQKMKESLYFDPDFVFFGSNMLKMAFT